jgi:hypothetical protein
VEGMDDQELMAAAMSDEAPATEPVQEQPAPEPAQEGQPRDESGRFAPKAVEVEAQPVEQPAAEQPKPEQEPAIPPWRARELREARDAETRRASEAEERAQRLEAQLRHIQAQQPQKPPPDMYAEPEAWERHLTQQNQNAILQAKLELSEDWARDKYGDEKVDTAIKWAETLSHAERMRILHSRNPTREVVRQFDERQTLSQIGGDLSAYKAKVMDEALNDPAFMQKVADKLRGTVQTTNGRPAISLPPSLNKATGSNVGHDAAGGSMNDADLYAHAIRT